MSLEVWDTVTDDDPQPIEGGERALGRYVLCRELAAGGMGTVYLGRVAEALGLDRPIAIKVIHRHLARRADLVEMFQDEARIHARIQHPNVCSVFDFGQVDGTFYLAMEYLLGESLATLLREVGRRPEIAESARWPALVAKVFIGACEGLHAAHELVDDEGRSLCVVHRDVSPQNLFVTYDGNTKVIDFGVAHARGRMHATIVGGLKGKLAYMAPEQARLEPLDRRADIWALGVCLWEALAVRRLFARASEAGVIGAVDRGDIPPPSTKTRAPIPSELDEIVARALSRDVATRTPTARALGRELAGWLHRYPEPVEASDIAALLGSLFEPRRGRKREVVDTVLSSPPEPRPQTISMSLRLGAAASDPTRTPTLIPPSVPAPPADDPPRATARPWWALGAVAMLVGGGGLGWLATDLVREPPMTTLAPVVVPPLPAVPPPSVPPALPIGTPEMPEPARPDEPSTPQAREDPRPSRPTRPPRPEPVSAPSEAESSTGVVNVVTPGGWADVLVDGRSLGRTPRRITLPRGRRTLELRPFGRTPGERVQVDVDPDAVARVVLPVAR